MYVAQVLHSCILRAGMKNMETPKHTIEEVVIAKANTNGIPFASFAKIRSLTKGTEAYKAAQKEYDRYCKVMTWATAVSKGNGRVRAKGSLLSPSKHRLTETSGTMEGTVLHTVLEVERMTTDKAFCDGWTAKASPTEYGISEPDFVTIAKHKGLIPLSYLSRNENGNMVYTKERVKDWLRDHNAAMLELRKPAVEIVPAVKATKAKAA